MTNELPFLNYKFEIDTEHHIKESAIRMLRIIKPTWNAEHITFKVFTAGITNKIICATNGIREMNSTGRERVLFRIFGNNTEKIIDREKEIANWQFLASHGHSAPIYARFTNGVVSGFLHGETLSVESVRSAAMITKICESLAKFHRLKPKTANDKMPMLFSKIDQYLRNISRTYRYQDGQKQLEYEMFLKKICFQTDLDKLTQIISKLKTEIVFCHNDLLVHNIIYSDKTGAIKFIDYEYADYNYQGFDIANHFCEYAGVEDFASERCPNDEHKRQWIEQYLTFYLGHQCSAREVDILLKNNGPFEMAAHFFWALWAFVQSQNSPIQFDYLRYGIQRYELFQKALAEIEKRRQQMQV